MRKPTRRASSSSAPMRTQKPARGSAAVIGGDAGACGAAAPGAGPREPGVSVAPDGGASPVAGAGSTGGTELVKGASRVLGIGPAGPGDAFELGGAFALTGAV